ncbi:unnamed protein product [Protopolystoma xenopodis]|uniref:Uncharacterized protein n=1 Tax=Protopolystoma xenopodis TaxID=117903 RepID=A0A448WIW6_9PLAT|nr:unnamed protein product [Protopolystoma xenopodis]
MVFCSDAAGRMKESRDGEPWTYPHKSTVIAPKQPLFDFRYLPSTPLSKRNERLSELVAVAWIIHIPCQLDVVIKVSTKRCQLSLPCTYFRHDDPVFANDMYTLEGPRMTFSSSRTGRSTAKPCYTNRQTDTLDMPKNLDICKSQVPYQSLIANDTSSPPQALTSFHSSNLHFASS